MINTLKNASLKSKRILMRADLDVPLVGDSIQDTFRLERMFDSIEYLLAQKPSKLCLTGHLGRPKGQENSAYSLTPIKDYFQKKYGENVSLLENLRFDKREEEGSAVFAQELASGFNVFVQEAFSALHRKHTSTYYLPLQFKAPIAGINLCRELTALEKLVLAKVARPYIVIIGGAKSETKIPLINKFKKIADTVLLGSKYLGDDLDLSEDRIHLYESYIHSAKTILWNGPVGQYEVERYALGTKRIAQAIAASSAFTIVGGGSTIDSLRDYNLLDRIDFVSTGGGAMLEFLAGVQLPGLEALGYYS